MNRDLRTDFENIPDGATVILHPADANMLHREPVQAKRDGAYYFCDGSDWTEGADYSARDVATFCRGYEMAEVTA